MNVHPNMVSQLRSGGGYNKPIIVATFLNNGIYNLFLDICFPTAIVMLPHGFSYGFKSISQQALEGY